MTPNTDKYYQLRNQQNVVIRTSNTEAAHEIMVRITSASSEHSDEPSHYLISRLARAFAASRDFPRPDLGPNIGPFPLKMSENFLKSFISFPIF